jgi:EAL domain-containing protein (putative c-di-GMP-specific phosphodiesterase class I)/GGDEF domain-containing protein
MKLYKMVDSLFKISSRFFFPKKSHAFLFFLCLSITYLCIYKFIYHFGGTSNSNVHLMYIPIVLSALIYGVWGGLLSGLVATIIVGPLMPMSVENDVLQPNSVWIFRGVFFLLIGSLVGLGSMAFKSAARTQHVRLMTDPLTGLRNLRGLRSFLIGDSDTLSDTDLLYPEISIVLIELRQLPNIEKAIGAEATHKLLKAIGSRLEEIAAEKAKAAYLETGSFVLLATGEDQGHYYMELCRTILGNVFNVDNIPIFVEFYFGSSHSSYKNEDIDSVLRKAKVAAVKAASSRSMTAFYSIDDDVNSKRNIRITHDLSVAILESQLKLVYQPKYCLKTMQVVGMEALVRWPHPELGMIPPAEFIPVIENTLLINPFTKWLLQEVVQQMLYWKDLGIEVPIAVNFSMMNFLDHSVMDHMHKLLEQSSIPNRLLEIEVTETAVSQNIQHVADVLHGLRASGIRIAIDDFGTGQASMQYLCELPVDCIKIDKFFVQDMLTNSASEAIVRSSILLSHELNLTVVAEGIESQEHFDKLLSIGCDYGQGYLMAKPMYPEEVIKILLKDRGGS